MIKTLTERAFIQSPRVTTPPKRTSVIPKTGGWGYSKKDQVPVEHKGWGAASRAPSPSTPVCPAQPSPLFKLYQSKCPVGGSKAPELIKSWIDNFLAKPHADLHAPDPTRPVCPFIPTAIKRNSILMQVVDSPTPDSAAVRQVLNEAKAEFLTMAPTEGQAAMFKTIIIAFPNLSADKAPEVIDQLQRDNKIDFVKDGLMLGEFHSQNNTPGLYNPEFKPLRTPIPALAIRYMVDSDILFLDDPKYTAAERVTFLSVFLRQDFNKHVEPAKEALQRAIGELKEQQGFRQ